MVVRLPRIHWATVQAELEWRWLPRLAPHLPLAVPEQLAMGEPGKDYPWRWAVYRWLEGNNAIYSPADSVQTAADLTRFIHSLQAIDPLTGLPPTRRVAGGGARLYTDGRR
jgi:aminoglycoside phosphotransferase (APT) family kinase protein